MKRILHTLLLLLFTITTHASGEPPPPVQRYIDLGHFTVNLTDDKIARFKAQIYVTSKMVETLVKLHRPHIRGTIMERFSELSSQKIRKVKKRKKFIKKLTRKIRTRIPKYDLPIAEEVEAALDSEDFREILLTSIFYG